MHYPDDMVDEYALKMQFVRPGRPELFDSAVQLELDDRSTFEDVCDDPDCRECSSKKYGKGYGPEEENLDELLDRFNL